MTWVDSNGTDGKPTFRRCAKQSWLSAIFNHFVDIAAWSPKSLTMFTQKFTFLEKDPLRANFHKCFPKGFTTSQIDVLCANFVKFGWPEIRKVVRYLRYKKQFRRALLLSLLRGSRPKSARASSRQYTRSAPNFFQIRSFPAELQPDAWTSFKRAVKCFQYSAELQLLPE